MKNIQRIFAVALLMFTASVQFASAQSYESQLQAFFRSDDCMPYRTICRLAHPTNDFVSGSLYLDGSYIIVTIKSEDSDGTYTLKVRLHKSGDRFDSISKISDSDYAPTWFATNIIKMAANDIFEDYSSDTIARIENIYGQRLRDMDAKEMTLAALTLLLWAY